MTTKIEAVKNVFTIAATNEETVKNAALERVTLSQNEEEKSENVKQFKLAQTHERYNALMSDMSDKALKVFIDNKFDAQALVKQSRELKKRSIAMLEAVAHEVKAKDKALDAIMQRIAAKRDAKLSIATIQREMQHATDTQASYFKTCALFYNFAQYDKDAKELTFNYEHTMFSKLIEVYSK
jgi:SpoVK/Ycf46/Vps4 family AAA+-type ATPase